MINIDELYSSPLEICFGIARRLKSIRIKKHITQKKLAEMSGVSYSSLRRFESTGQIELKSLAAIAFCLDRDNELKKIFTSKEYTSIQEIIDEQNQ